MNERRLHGLMQREDGTRVGEWDLFALPEEERKAEKTKVKLEEQHMEQQTSLGY